MRKLLALIVLLVPLTALASSAACTPLLPVSINIGSDLKSSVAGSTVDYTVHLQNESSTLVHDAHLAVELVPTSTAAAIVRFVDPEPIALLPDTAGEVHVSVPIPADAVSGSYTVDVALIPQGARQSDVFSRVIQPRASMPLSIMGAASSLKVAYLIVNGSQVQPRAIAGISSSAPQVTARINNTTKDPYKGNLTWRVWAADAPYGSAPLQTISVPLEIHPTGIANELLSVASTTAAGLYIEGEIERGGNSQFFDVWLRRNTTVFAELTCGASSPSGFGSYSHSWMLAVGALIVAAALAIYGVVQKFRTH